MVNLKEKPFCLSDEAIAWVEDTIQSMTMEEKQAVVCSDEKKPG